MEQTKLLESNASNTSKELQGNILNNAQELVTKRDFIWRTQSLYQNGSMEIEDPAVEFIKKPRKVCKETKSIKAYDCKYITETFSTLKGQCQQSKQESTDLKNLKRNRLFNPIQNSKMMKKSNKQEHIQSDSTDASSDGKHHFHEYEPEIKKQVHSESQSQFPGTHNGDAARSTMPESVSQTLSLLMQKLHVLKELHQLKVSDYHDLKNTQQEAAHNHNRQGREGMLMGLLSNISSGISTIKEKDEANSKALSPIGRISLPYRMSMTNSNFDDTPSSSSKRKTIETNLRRKSLDECSTDAEHHSFEHKLNSESTNASSNPIDH
jgi:hypothetical protein